jgi:hypothetical protein
MSVFWYVALCSLAEIGRKYVWNINQFVPDDVAQRLRIQLPIYSLLWDPEIPQSLDISDTVFHRDPFHIHSNEKQS